MTCVSLPLAALGTTLFLAGPAPAAATVRVRLTRHLATGLRMSDRGRGPRRRIPDHALPVIGALGCAFICVLLAGSPGVFAALVVAPVIAIGLRRQLGGRTASLDAGARAALPLTCDLIAAGLRAGASVPTALSSAASTAPRSLRIELDRVAAALRLGTPAARAWHGLASDPVLGPVAAIATRSADSGIRLADALTRRAGGLRDDLQAGSVARAERVGVIALLPLGLCFLPAFVCLGVVPIVAGIAADVFTGTGR